MGFSGGFHSEQETMAGKGPKEDEVVLCCLLLAENRSQSLAPMGAHCCTGTLLLTSQQETVTLKINLF